MPSELVKQLLEAGVHFGHKTSRWNPKMAKYIFGKKSGIYIIDLEKTEECLNKARDFLSAISAKGESVLFVGTKKQAQEVIFKEAARCSMYFVTERWPGGLLTNFATVKKSIARLKEIEQMKEDGTYQKLTKKEVAGLDRELAQLKKSFGGIVQMERMPGAIFIVDTKKEATAVSEANRLSIPIIGLIDTNSDPDLISYPIPGNDDATRSISAVAKLIGDTVMEGRKRFLSYLTATGVSAPQEKEDAVVLPPEEAQIKEIEEIVEVSEDDKEEEKPGRLSHTKITEDKAKLRPKTKR